MCDNALPLGGDDFWEGVIAHLGERKTARWMVAVTVVMAGWFDLNYG